MMRYRHGAVSLLVANILWGTATTALRASFTWLPPLSLSAVRYSIAALALSFLALSCWPALMTLLRQRMAAVLFVGVVGIGLGHALGAVGVALAGASVASILIATGPILVALLAGVFLRERHTLQISAAGLLALGGVAAIVTQRLEDWELAATLPLGAVFVLLGQVCQAASFLVSKSLLGGTRALPLAVASTAFGALALWPAAMVEFAGRQFVRPSALEAGLVLYLAIGVTCVAYLLNLEGLRSMPASKAGVFMYIQPLVATGLGALLLHEPVTPRLVLGMGLILGGLTVAMRVQQTDDGT